MINKIKRLCIALIFAILAPFQVAADEVTDVVNDVAAKLVQQLPMDKKIALKSLSPDETGLPEDFLHKLTSDLEAALLTASDFKINLANRATMEDVWQEAVEFNNADFEELFKSANADVMLMMSPRAISTGVEMAITAYALTGSNVGKTLASSGSVLLPIDLQANLGVNFNNLNQQMSQVLEEIEKVGQTGGLISNPNTYAEFYHNARILQQRGEVDLAMRNYEQALELGRDFEFVDPLMDLIDLASARYGSQNIGAYVNNKIFDKLSPNLQEFSLIYLGSPEISNFLTTKDTNKIADKFVPSLVIWLNQRWRDLNLEDNLRSQITRDSSFYVRDFFMLEVTRRIQSELSKGTLQKYFIDNIRALNLIDVQKLISIEKTLNRFEFVTQKINYQIGSGDLYINDPSNCFILFSEKDIFSITPEKLNKVSLLNFPDNETKRLELLDFLRSAHSACSNYNSTSLFNGTMVSRPITKPGIVQADLSNSFHCGPGEGCSLPDMSFYAERIQPPLIDGIDKYDINSLKGLYGGGIFGFYPSEGETLEISPSTDRVVFGDYFAQLARKFDKGGFIGSFSGKNDVTFNMISGFMITDSVNLDQPILLTMCDDNNEFTDCRVTDISKDGSYFRTTGVPLHIINEGEATYRIKKTDNRWLFVPGWIQSSIGRVHVIKVSYTSSSGVKKTLSNGYFVGNDSYYGFGGLKRTDIHPLNYIDPSFDSGTGLKNRFYDKDKVKQTAMCSMWGPVARVVNVNNFTNLRRQAGLNGQVIGQVPLGAKVSIINPGGFLQTERCAAACDGSIRGSLQCIENNEVWIEVDYNGRRGFLSRKFVSDLNLFE